MKKLRALIILLIFLVAPQAKAEGILPDVNQRELQTYFTSFAAAFGCTKNSHSKFSTINLGEMEFLPPDQNGTTWTTLYTVTVQILPNDTSLAYPTIHGYSASMLKNYAEHTKIIDSAITKAKDGTPVIYFEYKLRSGLLTEHGVGVYGRHTDTLAAFTRFEVRGRALEESEKDKMRKLASMLTQR